MAVEDLLEQRAPQLSQTGGLNSRLDGRQSLPSVGRASSGQRSPDFLAADDRKTSTSSSCSSTCSSISFASSRDLSATSLMSSLSLGACSDMNDSLAEVSAVSLCTLDEEQQPTSCSRSTSPSCRSPDREICSDSRTSVLCSPVAAAAAATTAGDDNVSSGGEGEGSASLDSSVSTAPPPNPPAVAPRRPSMTRSETVDIGELSKLRAMESVEGISENEDNADRDDDDPSFSVERMSVEALSKKRLLRRRSLHIPEVLLPGTAELRGRALRAPEALQLASPTSPVLGHYYLSPVTQASPLATKRHSYAFAPSGACSMPSSPSFLHRSPSVDNYACGSCGGGGSSGDDNRSDSVDYPDAGRDAATDDEDPYRVVGSKRSSSPFRFPLRLNSPVNERLSYGTPSASAPSPTCPRVRTASFDQSRITLRQSLVSGTAQHRSRSVVDSDTTPRRLPPMLSPPPSPPAKSAHGSRGKLRRLFRHERAASQL